MHSTGVGHLHEFDLARGSDGDGRPGKDRWAHTRPSERELRKHWNLDVRETDLARILAEGARTLPRIEKLGLDRQQSRDADLDGCARREPSKRSGIIDGTTVRGARDSSNPKSEWFTSSLQTNNGAIVAVTRHAGTSV